jgi:hypothetical protein
MELDKGKTADRKGTVKTVWQKTGMAFKKKKKISLMSSETDLSRNAESGDSKSKKFLLERAISRSRIIIGNFCIVNQKCYVIILFLT